MARCSILHVTLYTRPVNQTHCMIIRETALGLWAYPNLSADRTTFRITDCTPDKMKMPNSNDFDVNLVYTFYTLCLEKGATIFLSLTSAKCSLIFKILSSTDRQT